LFALSGFSWALATSGALARSEPQPLDSARAVASNFVFANPFVDPALTASVDRDLGDAVPGSIFAVRHVRARFGVLPYIFTAGTLSAFSNNSLSLDVTGLLHTGVAGSSYVALPSALPIPFRFLVSAIDGAGTQTPRSEPFLLNLLTNQNQFRFAIGPNLCDAARLAPYVDTLTAINGTPGYAFSVLPGSLSGGGKSGLSALESVGLSLSSDGTIFGQPLVSGPITFTAVCKDRSGNSARSRDGTKFNQAVTINVADSLVSQTTMVITSLTIGGNSAKIGNDKLSIAGVMNLYGLPPSKLSGNVTVRMGNYLSPAATFSTGTAKATNATTGSSKKQPTLTVKVSSKGQFKVQITHETFLDLNTLVGGGAGAATGVEIAFGAQLDGIQFLTIAGKTAKSKFSGSYKLGGGKKGNPTLAGAFMLTAVAGKDDTHGLTFGFDVWKASFIAVPPSGVTFGGATGAAVNVGATLQDSLSVTSGKGTLKASAKTASKSANKIVSLSMSEKGKGTYTTSPLDGARTGIPAAKTQTSAQSYATSIVVSDGATAVYGGSGSIVVFPGQSVWTSTNPSK
jgi:hypothetical protein